MLLWQPSVIDAVTLGCRNSYLPSEKLGWSSCRFRSRIVNPTWNSTIPATSSPTALKATIVDVMPEESNATNPRMIATASTHNKLANNIVVRN